MSHPAIDHIASMLYHAELDRRPVGPPRKAHPGLTISDAYEVQSAYARMRAEAGAKLVGYKVGATSAAARKHFGVDEPDFGHLFHDMRYPSGATVPLRHLIQPLVEPEFGFVLGLELRGPGVTANDVMASTSAVAPCLEIIDSRVRDWDIDLIDTISDNGSSARFVVGKPVPISRDLDLSTLSVELQRSGKVVGQATGAAVLGHPGSAVAWLANTFAGYDRAIPAGTLVLSGAVTAAVDCRPGDAFRSAISGLGEVACQFS